jgi:hypothetical protein
MAREPINKFIEYFSKPMSGEQLIYLNSINNVGTERVELFNDFIVSLCYLIHDTYLGDDVYSDIDDIKSHFDWCWNKNIDNFKKENLHFMSNGEHYYYFLNYFTEIYYRNQDKNKLLFNKVIDFWVNIFSLLKNKTKSEYDIFIEVYKTLNKYFIKPS